jgi:hypothetical protein
VAAAPRDHARGELAREDHRRTQVDRERAVDLLDGERGELAAARKPGVGHQHVDLRAFARQPQYCRGVGEVDRQRARLRLGGERSRTSARRPVRHELRARREQAAARSLWPEPPLAPVSRTLRPARFTAGTLPQWR